MRNLRVVLPLVVVSLFAFSGTALADGFTKPTASIGSTTGSGPKGCVRKSKVVKFTVSANDVFFVTSAKVTLDGKEIDSKNFGAPIRKKSILAGGISFTTDVNLAGSSAGAHTLAVAAAWTEISGLKGIVESAVQLPTGTAKDSAKIVKCAKPKHKKKPKHTHFTG